MSPLVAHLLSDECDVTGEVFSVGGGFEPVELSAQMDRIADAIGVRLS